MPDLMGKTDADVYKTMSGFQFSAVEIGDLSGDGYTIANILVDETGSVGGFDKELEQCIKQIVDACKDAPQSEQLMIRVATFSSLGGGRGNPNVREMHGFNIMSNINTDDYDGKINPNGSTPLLDATLDSLETVEAQGKLLDDQDFGCNAIFFVITDGGENSSSKASYKKIMAAFTRIRKEEKLESIQSFLVGVDDATCQSELDDFKVNAGFDNYISMGDVTPKKLAKLADWVSQSISSTSTAIGSGAPSQPVAPPSFTI